MAWRAGISSGDQGADAPARRPGRLRRALPHVSVALLLVVVLLVVARLALPGYLQDYVNRVIDRSPEYDGRIGKVEVHLWRGAYTVHDLNIVKTTHAVPVPFFEGRRVDFSLDWDALFDGKARGKVVMEKPRLNFVHGPSPEETQTGVEQPWLDMLNDLYPFRIDKAEVKDGEIHLHVFHTSPRVNAFLSEVEASVENLTNVEDKLDPLIATVHATGTAMESGKFKFDMSLDPQSHRPNFSMAAQIIDLDVRELNSLARAFGDFDFEGGKFDFVIEVTTRDGRLDGYAKPLFRNVTVLSLRDFETDDPLQLLWEALVGIVGTAFKNQPRDQFGTRITLTGDLDNPRMNILEIVGNVLRNAFIRAYLPRVEGRVAPEAAANEDDREESDAGS